MGLFDNSTTTNQNTLQRSNQTTTTAPYRPATGLLNTALQRAGKLYSSGKLVPAMNDAQSTGINTEYYAAKRAQPVLDQGLQSVLGISQDARGPSYAEQYLGDVASGSQIGANDPNFERLLSKAMANAATEAGMVASGMGRTGSDYHQTAVADTVGNLEASQRLARLQDQERRQMEAIGAMDTGRLGGMNTALNAAGALPGMAAATLAPGQALQGLGNRITQDALDRRGFGQLAQILGLANGLGTTTSSGTNVSTGTGTAEGPDNTLGQILGGGLGLASLLKGFAF